MFRKDRRERMRGIIIYMQISLLCHLPNHLYIYNICLGRLFNIYIYILNNLPKHIYIYIYMLG